MNATKVQNEINAIIETVNQPAHKQYPAAKHQIETLKSFGILDFVPARKRGDVIGYADAAAVIEAAQDSGKTVGGFNRDGEGDVTKIGASALYLAINEVENTAAPMWSDSDDFEDMEDYEETERENEHLDALMNEVSDMEEKKWLAEQQELESVLTAAEVDHLYNLGDGTARQACNRGQIRARKSGATWLIHRADADKMWKS